MEPLAGPLNPDATWNDEGLVLTLILCILAFTGLGAVSTFALYAPWMWLRRVFRVNHTAVVMEQQQQQYPSSDSEDTTLNKQSDGLQPRRVGRSLPYPCSLFVIPSLRSWLSVEEEVEGLESIFKPLLDSVEDEKKNHCGDCVANEEDCTQPGSPPREDGRAPGKTTHHPSRRSRVQSASVLIASPVDSVGERFGSPQDNDSSGPPKTPLDPHVAVYIAFLKLFATVFIVGFLINVWICLLSWTDNYVEVLMVRRDDNGCRLRDANKTVCMEMMPFCHYTDADTCVPVPLHGLYDLSLQNIAPLSWRLWFVALLDMGFCLLFIVSVVYYLRQVDKYVQVVMRHQMEHAVGHRVVVVGGLKGRVLSEEAFRKRYLQEEAYFGPNRRGVNAFRYPLAAASALMGGTLTVDDGETYYQYDCSGLGCIFSSCFYTKHKTTRSNALFLREGSVRRMLFPRDPPNGMYGYMEKTEEAMEGLQEAVADYKVFHSLANHVSLKKRRELHKKLLLTRAPFPFCFSMVSKVDYWKKVFIDKATSLNRCIDETPARNPKGIAFVVFDNALAAYEFINLFYAQHRGASGTWAAIAGPPSGVIEINIRTNRQVGWLRRIVVSAIYVTMLLFWSIPVGFISSIDNIAKIPGMGWLSSYFSRLPENVRGAVAALLPVTVLALFNVSLPYIMRILVLAMGVINKMEREVNALHLQYLFMVLTGVVFQAALQGNLEELKDMIINPSIDAVFDFFVALVSPKGGYWYAKVIMGASITTWTTFIDPFTLGLVVLQRKLVNVQRAYNELFGPCLFEWPYLYSFDLTILSMGLLFHMTLPLLSFFVGIYFVMRYFTQRGMLYDRYRPENHPRQDCTAFSAPGMVIRAACWLYSLGALGGVLFMSVRFHVGGTVICTISFGLSVILVAYAHTTTRRWVESVTNARRLLGNSVLRSSHSPYGTSRSVDNLAFTQPCVPQCGPMSSNAGRWREEEMLKSPTEQHPSRPSGTGSRVGVRPNNGSSATSHFSWQDQERHAAVRSVDGEKSPTLGNTYRPQEAISMATEGVVEWDAVPTTKEDMLYHRMSLLPHHPNVDSRYNPRHQQLQRINITREIERLEETVFHVERYWDVPYAEVSPEEYSTIEQR
uniref:CSC1/OSCA1-like 7TM region domain-containing protein n=1 Tax=Trypanosoma congolense (strain IL3000) TaxID=1068625 RepID=G0USC3_TRYCI|nr:conserved hypothetical protein [Trypanosoma congolense IL3000]